MFVISIKQSMSKVLLRCYHSKTFVWSETFCAKIYLVLSGGGKEGAENAEMLLEATGKEKQQASKETGRLHSQVGHF